MADGLKTYGWNIRLVEQYSQEEFHKILKQEPPAGLPLAAGQPLTLTVSGGTTLTLQVNLSNQIWLDAANLPLDQIKRGGAINLTLFWRAQKRLTTPYVVFIHLLGPGNNLVQQKDTEPGNGASPTTAWSPNAVVADSYVLNVPQNVQPGEYTLRVGLYPSGLPATRLAVTDPGKTTVDSNSILIKTVTILP